MDILYRTNRYFKNLRFSPSSVIYSSHFFILMLSHVKSCKFLVAEISFQLWNPNYRLGLAGISIHCKSDSDILYLYNLEKFIFLG